MDPLHNAGFRVRNEYRVNDPNLIVGGSPWISNYISALRTSLGVNTTMFPVAGTFFFIQRAGTTRRPRMKGSRRMQSFNRETIRPAQREMPSTSPHQRATTSDPWTRQPRRVPAASHLSQAPTSAPRRPTGYHPVARTAPIPWPKPPTPRRHATIILVSRLRQHSASTLVRALTGGPGRNGNETGERDRSIYIRPVWSSLGFRQMGYLD